MPDPAKPSRRRTTTGRGHPVDIDAALEEALPLGDKPAAVNEAGEEIAPAPEELRQEEAAAPSVRDMIQGIAASLGARKASLQELEEGPRMGIPEGWDMIHTLMGRILADLGPVLKAERNLDQKYNFRGVDSVVNAVNGAFKTHRVYITSEIIEARFQATRTTGDKATREVTGKIRYWFNAPDGSRVPTEVLTEALDQSDKGGPKSMSVALRIALLQTFLLPTNEPTTDHEYLTRDGQSAMPPSTAALVLAAVEDPATSVARLRGELWAVVVEHSAWDRQAPGDPSERTWLQVFADRYARQVSAVMTFAEGKALKEEITAARALDWQSAGKSLDAHLIERGAEVRRTAEETFDHVMEHILSAQGVDELDVALGCMEAAIEARTLPETARAKLVPVADERRPKLPAEAPQPEPAERGPFDEPTEEERAEAARRLQAFALRAAQAPIAGQGETPELRERAVVSAIKDLLTGEFSNDPAGLYGSHGFQLVFDAILSAHRRERSIGDDARHELELELHRARELGNADDALAAQADAWGDEDRDGYGSDHS